MNILKKILPLLLIFSILISMASCVKKNPDNTNDPSDGGEGNVDGTKPGEGEYPGNTGDPSAYSVTVLSPYGKPLSGVTVFIHKDGGADYNVCTAPVQTNASGRAEFTLDPEYTYSVQLVGYPEAYSAKGGNTPSDRYSFDGNSAGIVLGLNNEYNPESYSVGSPMADFSITDIDGNTYELSELLKTKKVVMLNFWFYGCPPCAAEFPAVNTAYASFKNDIEILAVNDYPSDTVEKVEGYESYRGFDLDMPLFKVGYGSEVSITRFPSNGYPTTVIIDRYGIVSTIHIGAVTSASAWNQLFAYYTSDSYDGTPYNF